MAFANGLAKSLTILGYKSIMPYCRSRSSLWDLKFRTGYHPVQILSRFSFAYQQNALQPLLLGMRD